VHGTEPTTSPSSTLPGTGQEKIPPKRGTQKAVESREKFTVAQIRAALDATADNITKAALRLHCHRATLYSYIERYPELQAHRPICATAPRSSKADVSHYRERARVAEEWLQRIKREVEDKLIAPQVTSRAGPPVKG
jgi:hypothetical protein